MSLSRSTHPNRSDRKRKANGDFANTFPILGLPRELISHVLSFLGPKDRLTARVCQELNAIEAESKYYVEKLEIATYKRNSQHHDYFTCNWSSNTICLLEDQSHSIDGIRRIAQNASIGTLVIHFGGSEELDRDLYDLINEFNVDYLTIYLEDSPTVQMLMQHSFIGHIPNSCKSLEFEDCNELSADALHEVYEAMMNGTTNIQKFSSKRQVDSGSFLDLIGFSVEDKVIHSRKDVEVYKLVREGGGLDGFYVFNGNLEMLMRLRSDFHVYSHFILHETRESLEEAKGKLVDYKVDVIRDAQ